MKWVMRVNNKLANDWERDKRMARVRVANAWSHSDSGNETIANAWV